MIEMKDIMKKYSNGTTAIRNLSISIDQGEFVYVVGPSGAGKSTFIKLMYREERATKGVLNVAGYDLVGMKNREIPLMRRKSAWSSKTTNFYRGKRSLKMLLMQCKLSDANPVISKNG